MITVFPGDDDFVFAFAAAFMIVKSEPQGPVGTEHLLYGATLSGPAVKTLASFELTPAAVRAVLRDGRHDWVSADVTTEVPSEPAELKITDSGEPVHFTAAAAAAMRRAQRAPVPGGGSTRGPADVLAAILDDEDCRGAELVSYCGADLAELRRSLRSGEVNPIPDRVPPELVATRDALLGRRRYQGPGLRNLLMSFVARARVDYGRHPCSGRVSKPTRTPGGGVAVCARTTSSWRYSPSRRLPSAIPI